MTMGPNLDPPDEGPEFPCPECEDGFGTCTGCEWCEDLAWINLVCDECGHQWTNLERGNPYPEPPEDLDWDEMVTEGPEKCPHGNEWHECNACLEASDQAYDAEREKR